jgi:hypothetical protein
MSWLRTYTTAESLHWLMWRRRRRSWRRLALRRESVSEAAAVSATSTELECQRIAGQGARWRLGRPQAHRQGGEPLTLGTGADCR